MEAELAAFTESSQFAHARATHVGETGARATRDASPDRAAPSKGAVGAAGLGGEVQSLHRPVGPAVL